MKREEKSVVVRQGFTGAAESCLVL